MHTYIYIFLHTFGTVGLVSPAKARRECHYKYCLRFAGKKDREATRVCVCVSRTQSWMCNAGLRDGLANPHPCRCVAIISVIYTEYLPLSATVFVH